MASRPHSRDDFKTLREAVQYHRRMFQPTVPLDVGTTEAERALQRIEEQYQALHAAASKLFEAKLYVMKPGETPLVMEPNALDELKAVLRGSNPAKKPLITGSYPHAGDATVDLAALDESDPANVPEEGTTGNVLATPPPAPYRMVHGTGGNVEQFDGPFPATSPPDGADTGKGDS